VIESLVNTLLQWATRRSRLVTNAAALLAGVAIAALPHLQVDTDVLHLLPRNGPATPAFTRYLHEFGSLDRVYVRARQIERAGLDVQRAREDLATATTAAGFRASAFAPFDERLPRVLQPRQRLTCDGFQQNGLEDVLAPLVRATPGGYTAVAYAFPTTPAQAEAVKRAVTAVGGTLVLTGTPVVNRELETRFWPQFRLAAAVAGIAVMTLIVIGFRSVQAMLFAMLPTALGLVWALGVIGFAGVELDLFSVFGLLTFLGIGVDYGIHVVHRWRTLHDPVAVVVRLGPALLLAGGTTLAGFGTLCFSAYPPLRSLGIVLFTTVTGALVASLTALPVLLKGRRP
jgi:predicted RND superfamily exporter protein